MTARDKARKLHAKGLTYREIAKRVGVHPRTVARYCSPETARRDAERNLARNEYKREHERNHRAPCPFCGGPMGAGSGCASHAPDRCDECRKEAERQRVEVRGHRIEEWWAEGLKLREIAERLGWSKDHMGVEIFRLRARGFNLPKRKPGRPKKVAA